MRISDWSSDVCSSDLVRSKFPPDVGSKFYADGRVHPFPGNTVICHVPQQGEHSGCFNALLDIYREAPAHPFVRKITLLPPSSYHMTIFGGANDKPRERKSWPADLPIDMPIERCRSEEHTSELQSLMRISYAVFCLKTTK